MKKKELWPAKKLNLNCLKLKYFNCQVAANDKICVKGHKCDTYKIFCLCSSLNCWKNWQYDIYIYKDEIGQYMSKKYYIIQKRKCKSYDNLSSKNGNILKFIFELLLIYNLACYA